MGQAVSRVVDDLSAVVEVDKRIERLREQERKTVERSAKARQKHHAARAQWERDAIEAELDGKAAKAPPEPPNDSVRTLVLGRLRAEIDEAIKDRRRAVVDHEGEIRAEVEQQAAALVGEAIQPLSELHDLVRRVRGVVSALDDVHDARVALDPKAATTARRPPRVDLDLLASAVDRDVGVLLAGRDPRPPRVLGIQPGTSTLHLPPAEIPDPPSPAADVTNGPTAATVRTNSGAEP